MAGYPCARGASGVLRRVGAGFYDGLLLFGLLMVAVGAATYLTRGAAPAGRLAAYPFRFTYSAIALGIIVAYFGGSWRASGETLGMKAWGLRLVARSGSRPEWRAIGLRLALGVPLWLAPVAGLLLYMSHRSSPLVALCSALPLAASLAPAFGEGVSLHDLASGTRVLRVPRDAPV